MVLSSRAPRSAVTVPSDDGEESIACVFGRLVQMVAHVSTASKLPAYPQPREIATGSPLPCGRRAFIRTTLPKLAHAQSVTYAIIMNKINYAPLLFFFGRLS